MQAALHRLGIERLVLAIHQASFPAGDDDLASGTPYGASGGAFIAWIAGLGFDGLMLGPGGVRSRDNPSPYDGSALSRDPMHIAWGELRETPWHALVDRALLDRLAGRAEPDRSLHAAAWDATRALLDRATTRLDAPGASAQRAELAQALASGDRWWLGDEARFEGLAAAAGHDDWPRWPASLVPDARAERRFGLGQVLVHQQHAALRARLAPVGLRLYGDLAIGMAHRDRWGRGHLLLPGYAMGAPPSRTNPAGQAWGFPVLAPPQLAPGGAARALVVRRLEKLIAEHDGVRVDHPHGWICPWVYRTDTGDDGAAVRSGARLYESPDLPDHPALAPFARVAPEQLDRARPRHDDAWVIWLRPDQTERYAEIVDALVEGLRARGRAASDVVVEVLSTCPRPLQAVLDRHGLGRFRVTQKAVLDDPRDVYRGESAHAADWIMVGNHDTAPLRAVVDGWFARGEQVARAAYLADRLAPGRDATSGLAARFASSSAEMATAMMADLFVGPARHVQIFWTDLFGLRDWFNRPGTVDDANWTLRVPPDFAAALARAHAAGDAPSLNEALALALTARGLDRDPDGRALSRSLAGSRAPAR